MAIKHIKPLRELIPIGVLAELAQAPRTNLHIAAHARHKVVSVGRAAHARRREKARKLGVSADDGDVVGHDAELAFEEVVEWGQPKHPTLPKVRKGRVGDDNAAEGDDEEEEEGDEEGGKHGVWCHGGDELPEADVEDFEEADHHEDVAGGEAEGKPDSEVPAAEEDTAAEEGVGDFGEDGAEGKGGPGVDLGFGFAEFEDVAEGDVPWLELLD